MLFNKILQTNSWIQNFDFEKHEILLNKMRKLNWPKKEIMSLSSCRILWISLQMKFRFLKTNFEHDFADEMKTFVYSTN